LAARSSELLVNTSLAVADVPLSVVEQRDIVMHVIECDSPRRSPRSRDISEY
jgi:hypothetical protein